VTGILGVGSASLTEGGATPGTPLSGTEIVVHYGGVVAVNGVTVRAAAGAVTGIIGPNGAGKSSLIAVLAGAQRPASGRVLLGERDITHLRPHQRSELGLLRTFQTARIFSRLSVLENVIAGTKSPSAEGLVSALLTRRKWRSHERASTERALGLLAEFGMLDQAERRCGELSGGQRRIVEYLRVLMARPSVILLDEPTVGMAPWLVARLADDLATLRSSGVCVVLVGHEMGFIRQVCDVVIVMANGEAIAEGSFDEVAENDLVRQAYLGRRAGPPS